MLAGMLGDAPCPCICALPLAVQTWWTQSSPFLPDTKSSLWAISGARMDDRRTRVTTPDVLSYSMHLWKPSLAHWDSTMMRDWRKTYTAVARTRAVKFLDETETPVGRGERHPKGRPWLPREKHTREKRRENFFFSRVCLGSEIPLVRS